MRLLLVSVASFVLAACGNGSSDFAGPSAAIEALSVLDDVSGCHEVPESEIDAANAASMVFCGWQIGSIAGFVTVPFFDSEEDASDYAAQACTGNSRTSRVFYSDGNRWVVLGLSTPESVLAEIASATGIEVDSSCGTR